VSLTMLHLSLSQIEKYSFSFSKTNCYYQDCIRFDIEYIYFYSVSDQITFFHHSLLPCYADLFRYSLLGLSNTHKFITASFYPYRLSDIILVFSFLYSHILSVGFLLFFCTRMSKRYGLFLFCLHV
jgi:hypothetical protein